MDKLLRVEGLCQHFGANKAVENVSFSIRKGEIFGLVGESGSGKTTTGRCIMGLYPITAGRIYFGGHCIREAGKKTIAARRACKAVEQQIQMIFQDPMASLDPRMTVRESIAEGLIIAGERDRHLIGQKVESILELVGLRPEYAGRYPHEFSGGQRQRIGIARAVIMEPALLVADEPVSALDVSVQAQVINLLGDLRQRLELAILFIAHDLSVVKYFCDRVAVMRHGRIVELADTDTLFSQPQHPYTKSLLSAIPVPDPRVERARQRIVYDEQEPENGVLREVAPGHWVYTTRQET